MGHFRSRGGFLLFLFFILFPRGLPCRICSFCLCGGVGLLHPPSTCFSVLLLLCWFLTCGLSLGLHRLFLLEGWGWLLSRPGHLPIFISVSLLPSPPGQQNLAGGRCHRCAFEGNRTRLQSSYLGKVSRGVPRIQVFFELPSESGLCLEQPQRG